MSSKRKWKLIVAAGMCFAIAATLSLFGCSSGGASSEAASSASAAAGDSITDLTVKPGVLTVATGSPAYPPYVMGDAPETGEGFEAALTYAVAEKLGFHTNEVVWVRTGFDEAITPGEKDWDMNIQQFGITADRMKAVDFSSPYFTPSQAIIVDAAEGHDKYAKATSCAELADAVIGAETGSTSYTYAVKKLDADIQAFNSNADAVNALNAHQIDGIIVDTPTGVYMANPEMEQLDAAVLIGRLPDSEADPLAFILPKGSKLTDHVSIAIEELREDGILQQLTNTWMAEYTTDVPVLE